MKRLLTSFSLILLMLSFFPVSDTRALTAEEARKIEAEEYRREIRRQYRREECRSHCVRKCPSVNLACIDECLADCDKIE